MKFKSNIFYEYTHLKDIEITLPKKEVIEKLQFLNGVARNQRHNDRPMGFECRKNGKVFAGDYNFKHGRVNRYSRTYAIHGNLEEQDEKTVLKLYVYHTKGRKITLTFSAVLVLIDAIIFIMALILRMSFDMKALILIPVAIVTDLAVLFYEYREMTSWEQDGKILLEEIENRINAVINWEK